MHARLVVVTPLAALLLACPGVASLEDAGPDAGAVERDAGPFAYDARPANPTCRASAPPPGPSAVTTQRAFPNLSFNAPLLLISPPHQPTRVVVLERDGTIQRFPYDQAAATADVVQMLDITGRVDTSGEGGLLGIAFHPDWPNTPEVFLSYTATGGSTWPLTTTLSRFRSTDGGDTIDPASEEKLFELQQPYSNHNGGMIAFGRDGYLYLGLGDGGSGGDPEGRAQRLNTNLGKFIRLDVNVPFIERYRIPPDNPFAADNTPCNKNNLQQDAMPATTRCAEIYAVGVRNPWRWSFDMVSGELWAGDVGQGTYEEVDLIVRGANYGWNVREGLHCYNAATCATAGFTDPVIDYARTDGNSVTGGFVYRGTSIPGLVGRFIYGDYGSGKIFALEPTATGGYQHTELVDTSFGLAAFGQTADGEVYALDINTGQIHQLVPMGMSQPDTFPKLLSQTGCFDAQDPTKPVAGLIPYDLNAPLWSDGAQKERHFAIPDGATITVQPDGDFDLPIGSVVSKTFSLGGKRIETRLLMRHADGSWGGYSYEWNDAQTDATLLPAAKLKDVGTQSWLFPSRAQCLRCHTAIAGRTLGLELAQLNRTFRYPAVGATRHQLTVLEGLGYLSAPLSGPVDGLARLESPLGTGPLEARARSWLHANCSICHRAGAGQGPADFRFSLSFKDTKTCDVAPDNGDLGVTGARLIKPGVPAQSIVSLRVHALDAARMPPLGTAIVDVDDVAVIDQWISSLNTCPP
ncbi:MAG: PQQ-dependent sugar dehydrogenase [Myxococcaceae bacterium]